MTRKLLVVLAAVAGALCVVPSAQALTTPPVWKCRASPLYASVNGQNRVEPIVANGNINTANGGNPDHAQCANAETGAGNTATQLGIPQDVIGASTGKAKTEIVAGARQGDRPEGHRRPRRSRTSRCRSRRARPSLLGVKAATSSATGTCVAGSTTPKLDGDEPGGRPHGARRPPIALDGLARRADGRPAAARRHRRDQDQREGPVRRRSLTVRALHVKVLRGTARRSSTSSSPRARSASTASSAIPTQQDGGGTPTEPVPGGLRARRRRQNVCIIRAATSGSSLGDIIVGAPFAGPERRHGRADRHRAQAVRAQPVPER